MKNFDEQNSFEETEFFEKVDVPFQESKEELWANFSKKIDFDGISEKQIESKKNTKIISMIFYRVAAAVIIFVTGSVFYLQNASNTIVCKKGDHISHKLPDGSIVHLNASSTISYHPHWWYFNREVLLDGEAFFNVEKGQKFSVVSGDKITEVLGTSFNIYAREKKYKVFCKTGKVKVSNPKIGLTILPGELVKLDAKDVNTKVETAEENEILSWQQYKFIYNAESLIEVFKEIERQYNTTIQLNLNSNSEYIFTGYFTKNTPLDSTIEVISNRFNLQTIKNKNNQYIISAKYTEI